MVWQVRLRFHEALYPFITKTTWAMKMYGNKSGTLASLKGLLTFNLQTKILLLVLVPLVISSSCLLVLEAIDRIDANRAHLEQQRKLMIDARRHGVESIVSMAKKMVESE